MACSNGGKALMNFTSKARSAIRCCKKTNIVCEMASGNTGRYMPSVRSGSAYVSGSPSTILGNRRLSSYLLSRLPKEVACTQSLLPLYSVTASARLVAQLSTNAGISPADLHGTLTRKPPDN